MELSTCLKFPSEFKQHYRESVQHSVCCRYYNISVFYSVLFGVFYRIHIVVDTDNSSLVPVYLFIQRLKDHACNICSSSYYDSVQCQHKEVFGLCIFTVTGVLHVTHICCLYALNSHVF